MKKNRIKLCAGLLAVVMSVVGCQSESGGSSKPVNPVNVTETNYATNTLHKVTIKEADRPFIVDGKSEYKIIAGADEKSQEAAYYLASYLEKATGCRLEMAKPEDYKADGKFIVLNENSLFDAAGLTMPEDDLGIMGYYIKSVGDNLFMSSNYDTGARFAMLAFLRNVVGFKMYSLECVKFEKDGATLPDMDIIEKPDIPYFYRMHNEGDEPEEFYMMGFMNGGFINIDGAPWHNSLKYLPMEKYQAEHPNWYSTAGNDLCYTGHGNIADVDAMTTIIADRILEEAAKDPNAMYATCTIMDHGDVCLCDACKESSEKYNGSDAAAVVKFTKKINEKVQAELQRQADEAGTKKRPMTIMFFAYYAMTQPPVTKNADGTYSAIDESVVLDKDMAVFYAPIKAQFNHSFYEAENQLFHDMMEGWNACSDQMFCWFYQTNFMYYMYPHNTWDAMIESYRFAVSKGAGFMIGQDQHNNGASTVFTDLKDYINSCAQYNVNTDYNEVLDDYFTDYYMEAGVPLRKYFDELRAWMRNLENSYPAEVNGDIYLDITQSKFWPKNTIEHWLDLIDEAYEAIEVHSDDKILYQELKDRITKESMFPRYVLIEHYSGMYSAEALNDMKVSFREDAQKLGFTRVGETTGGEMSLVYDRWGLK